MRIKSGLYHKPIPGLVDSMSRSLPGSQHKTWSCSCSLCSTSSDGSKGVAAGSEALITKPMDQSDLLKSTMDKNKALEEELEKMRLHMRASRMDTRENRLKAEDPDIAELLENNKRWVEEKNVSDAHNIKLYLSFYII